MFHINHRPIGTTTTLDYLRPCDIIPIYSKLDTSLNMSRCSEVIRMAAEEFKEKWKKIYLTSILRQKKWLDTNHSLQVGDVAMVNDPVNPQGYPRFAKIKDVQKDTSNIDRYFYVNIELQKP